ncbi:Lsr2 family protein [Streptomyces sp. NPDC002698]|uniref:histone-like nucleoid-structuring protein Lsr2 n=1 Tax=Streptomyces sp. NPDC002698 TaxID=3364660 RepID=UPI0036B45D30
MAQRTVVLLTDDLTGGDADETLAFSIDGKSYEIDLNDKNAAKLRKALAPFVEAGRKQSTKAAAGARRGAPKPAGEDTAVIREWAKQNGLEVNDRGRVPASIREAYHKANG